MEWSTPFTAGCSPIYERNPSGPPRKALDTLSRARPQLFWKNTFLPSLSAFPEIVSSCTPFSRLGFGVVLLAEFCGAYSNTTSVLIQI